MHHRDLERLDPTLLRLVQRFCRPRLNLLGILNKHPKTDFFIGETGTNNYFLKEINLTMPQTKIFLTAAGAGGAAGAAGPTAP